MRESVCVGNMTGVRRVRCSLCEGLRTTELQTAHLYRRYAGPQPVPVPVCNAAVQCPCIPWVHCTVHWGPHVFPVCSELYSAQVGGEQQATINCISLQATFCSRQFENNKKVFLLYFTTFWTLLNFSERRQKIRTPIITFIHIKWCNKVRAKL